MNPTDKKSPGARIIPQPSNRPPGHAPQVKPVVAQLKTGVSAQTVNRPVAPPVYRPQATPQAAQAKMANGALNRKPPVAPSVYRTRQVPKVLQTKSTPAPNPQAGQAPRQPVAPPAYRPEAKKIVQPKAVSPQRMPPTSPPVYRRGQERIAQPKMAPAASAPTPPKAAQVYRPQLNQVNAQPLKGAVVQRAADTKSVSTSTKIYDENMGKLKTGASTYPGVSDVLIVPGYESWTQDGVSYHINWKLGDSKKGKEVYHVTQEGTPKHHYFFILNPNIEDAVATMKAKSKTDHKFSDLPEKVKRFILTTMQYKFPHKDSMDILMNTYNSLLASDLTAEEAWASAWEEHLPG